MKKLLALTAVVFAATPALAYSYATRTLGNEVCRQLRANSSLSTKQAVYSAGAVVGYDIVMQASNTDGANKVALYVMNTCTDAVLAAPKY